MKNLVLSTILALSLAVPAGAQGLLPNGGQPAGGTVLSATTYFPVIVKFVGFGGGSVAVDAGTGDLTFLAAGVADTTLECPISGALGGVIDVSNAACNTLGEVVDAINVSANWRAVIQDGIRSDSSDNTLNTLANTSAAVPAGLALAGDSVVSLQTTIVLDPQRNDITLYLNGGPGTSTGIKPNKYIDTVSALVYANATATLTGADTLSIIVSEPNNKRCALNAAATAVSCSASESVPVTLSKPGATTGVNGNFNFTVFPYWSYKGQRILFRYAAATTLPAVAINSVGGFVFPFVQSR